MVRKLAKFANSSTLRACLFCVFALVVLASGVFSLFPTSVCSSSALGDFETFSETVMAMQKAFQAETVMLSEEQYEMNGDELFVSASVVSSLSLTGADVGDDLVSVDYSTSEDGEISVTTSTMRLIVYSDKNVNSHGAVMSASYDGWHIFQYDSVEAAESAFEALENEGFEPSYDELVSVEYTEEDSSDDGYEVESTASNPWDTKGTPNTWGYEYVGYSTYVANIYSRHTEAEMATVGTVYVAVLDSGIYEDHTIFYDSDGTAKGRIATDYAESFESTDTGWDYDYQDLNGHGTHVSGTIAELTTDNVKIIPVKILNSEGSGYTSSIINALSYIVNLKNDGLNIVVANMSVGVDLSSSSSSSTTSTKITAAVTSAYNAGIICVVSAGNSSTSTSYSSPANVDCAFTVSALSKSSSAEAGVTFASSYSNYGQHVDFAAPGTSIKSAGITSTTATRTLSGTSMAAPHVTAAVALIFCEPNFVDYSIDEVYKLLCDNAYDLGDSGWDQYYGYGMIYLANIGLEYESGYVTFTSDSEPTESGLYVSEIEVTLDYSKPSDATGYSIYYSLDENSTTYDSDSWSLYDGAITISETTRISAIAIVSYSDGSSKQTHSASAEFTFGTEDFLSNYTFTLLEDGTYEITSYSGTLSTLTLPSTYKSATISTLGDYFLKGTLVSVVYVPDSISVIDVSAFRANTTLTEVHFYDPDGTEDDDTTASSMTIGNFAFYNCKNLTTLDFGGQDEVITTIGTHVFAYVPALDELKLLSVTSIGKHAFSYSGLKTLWLGQYFESIDTQSGLSLEKVYGYSNNSVTTDFSDSWATTFVDILVTIEDFSSYQVATAGESFTLSVTYSASNIYATEGKTVFSGFYFSYSYYNEQRQLSTVTHEEFSSYIADSATSPNSTDGTFTSTVIYNALESSSGGNWSGTLYVVAEFVDYSGATVTSDEMTLTIAQSSSLYTMEIDIQDSESGDGNATVYINGEEVTGDSVTLVVGTTYTVTVEAENAYKLVSVVVNCDVTQYGSTTTQTSTMLSEDDSSDDTTSIYFYMTASSSSGFNSYSFLPSQMTIVTAFKDYLTVSFDTTYSGVEHASILVDGTEISSTTQVKRGNSLSFSLQADTGYTISSVKANGEELTAVAGVYTITVNEDIQIDVEYDVQTNSVSLVYGKDCGTVDWSGSSDLAVGESKTYTVTASDGYALDSVTLDSEEVEITVVSSGVYSFTITNTSGTEGEDLVVEISFKKDSGIGEILSYFVIFCVIFGVFVVASLILWLVRKRQAHKDSLMKDWKF